MGKINDILYTEQGSLTALSVSTAKSGMREERIEYMTKIVLCVAKLLRLPLDKTIKLIKEHDLSSLLENSYRVRRERGIDYIAKTIYRALKPCL